MNLFPIVSIKQSQLLLNIHNCKEQLDSLSSQVISTFEKDGFMRIDASSIHIEYFKPKVIDSITKENYLPQLIIRFRKFLGAEVLDCQLEIILGIINNGYTKALKNYFRALQVISVEGKKRLLKRLSFDELKNPINDEDILYEAKYSIVKDVVDIAEEVFSRDPFE